MGEVEYNRVRGHWEETLLAECPHCGSVRLQFTGKDEFYTEWLLQRMYV